MRKKITRGLRPSSLSAWLSGAIQVDDKELQVVTYNRFFLLAARRHAVTKKHRTILAAMIQENRVHVLALKARIELLKQLQHGFTKKCRSCKERGAVLRNIPTGLGYHLIPCEVCSGERVLWRK